MSRQSLECMPRSLAHDRRKAISRRTTCFLLSRLSQRNDRVSDLMLDSVRSRMMASGIKLEWIVYEDVGEVVISPSVWKMFKIKPTVRKYYEWPLR